MKKHIKQEIIINNNKIIYYVESKNIKNINLRVNNEKNIIVSIPKNIELSEVKLFIEKKYNWIKKQLDYYENLDQYKENITFEDGETVYLLGKQYKMKIICADSNKIVISDSYLKIYIKEKYFRDKKYISKIYEGWLKEYCYNIILNIVNKYYLILKKYNVLFPKVKIRKMKLRWGNCFPVSNKLIFNTSIIKVSICCIEYVVLYEMLYFIYQTSNKKLYNFMSVVMPDWRIRKKILDEDYSSML